MPAKRVVIVGAGAAGVFTAYRLRKMYGQGAYDVTIVEKRNRVGGNAYTKPFDVGGKRYSIDCGAQFFYKNAQVSYTKLLADLSLVDDPTKIVDAESGFTIWDRQADERRFYFPDTFGGMLTMIGQLGNVVRFMKFLRAARDLDEANDNNWDMSVDDWLAQLDVKDSFKDEVLKPFLYQFVSLPADRIGEASARYATTYMARNRYGEPGVDPPDVDPQNLKGWRLIETHQSLIGLDEIHRIVLRESGATLIDGDGVASVSKKNGALEVVTQSGRVLPADHVVLATDPPTSAKILRGSNAADPLIVPTLEKIEYAGLDIAIQSGPPAYMPRKHWEPINTIIDGNNYMFSVWFGPLRDDDQNGDPINVFKSWGANLVPAAVEGQGSTKLINHHEILYPTTTSIVARDKIFKDLNGKNNVWFVGGWTNWFDSQEASLDSATIVANKLDAAVVPVPITPYDPEPHRESLRRCIARMELIAEGDDKRELKREREKLEV